MVSLWPPGTCVDRNIIEKSSEKSEAVAKDQPHWYCDPRVIALNLADQGPAPARYRAGCSRVALLQNPHARFTVMESNPLAVTKPALVNASVGDSAGRGR